MVTKSPSISISIFEGQTIGAIQKLFSDHYPFLKIDFFKDFELNGIRVTKKLDNGFGLFRLPETTLDLNRTRTIASLKADINHLTGLFARIFRRSGNVWIETTLTDDWTLERQNEEGKQMAAD